MLDHLQCKRTSTKPVVLTNPLASWTRVMPAMRLSLPIRGGERTGSGFGGGGFLAPAVGGFLAMPAVGGLRDGVVPTGTEEALGGGERFMAGGGGFFFLQRGRCVSQPTAQATGQQL